MDKIVGIGEYAISNNSADNIKTFALASCVAVTAYSPARKIGGMVHIALPYPVSGAWDSRLGYYAATAVPVLIGSLCDDYGCNKGDLEIHIHGGADSINENDVFSIGKRNINAVMEVFSNLNLNRFSKDVGGTQSRTIELCMDTGHIAVTYQPIKI